MLLRNIVGGITIFLCSSNMLVQTFGPLGYEQARKPDLIPLLGEIKGKVLPKIEPSTTTAEPQIDPDCQCSGLYDPVCGTNDLSYLNVCFLDCTVGNVKLKHRGKCLPFRKGFYRKK